MSERDWRDEVIAAANAAGLKASRDEPDAILMADARNLLAPGSSLDRLAEALAGDLEAKAPAPVTRAACAALVRAAANLQGLTVLGYSSRELLVMLAAAGAKLEMRAKP
jgi:hypothetical protein